jgi:hypothetical protein
VPVLGFLVGDWFHSLPCLHYNLIGFVECRRVAIYIFFASGTYINSGDRKMTTKEKHHVPWYLWPFWAIWRLLATVVELTGRFLAMVLGLVLILAGVLVSLTVIGAIIGIPLAIIGVLLLLRGIF